MANVHAVAVTCEGSINQPVSSACVQNKIRIRQIQAGFTVNEINGENGQQRLFLIPVPPVPPQGQETGPLRQLLCLMEADVLGKIGVLHGRIATIVQTGKNRPSAQTSGCVSSQAFSASLNGLPVTSPLLLTIDSSGQKMAMWEITQVLPDSNFTL